MNTYNCKSEPKWRKRALSLLITAVMIMSLIIMPLTTFAAGTPENPVEINIGTVSGNGDGFTFDGTLLFITTNGYYKITGSATGRRIVINNNVIATIILNSVNITSTANGAAMITYCNEYNPYLGLAVCR